MCAWVQLVSTIDTSRRCSNYSGSTDKSMTLAFCAFVATIAKLRAAAKSVVDRAIMYHGGIPDMDTITPSQNRQVFQVVTTAATVLTVYKTIKDSRQRY